VRGGAQKKKTMAAKKIKKKMANATLASYIMTWYMANLKNENAYNFLIDRANGNGDERKRK